MIINLSNRQITSNFLVNNLQLPCVQPPTSSYNFQLAMVNGHHGYHGNGAHGGHGGCGDHGKHGGQERTGQDKLTFPGNL